MKEDFLHYLWKNRLYNANGLQTVSKKTVTIISPGIYNTNAGPDFLNAKIKIGSLLWVGNIEMHLKSSDWYTHKHEKDSNYDNVILHVVWENDMVVFKKGGYLLPTLQIQSYTDESVLRNYNRLSDQEKSWLYCESELPKLDKFVLSSWLDRLYIERLEQKSVLIHTLLKESANNWEAVLFKLLAKNFGLKINGDAFFDIASSVDFTVVRKEKFSQESLEALMYGQAGLLNEENGDLYYEALKLKYGILKSKYALEPVEKSKVQFFRLRPMNFPTLRISQFCTLLIREPSLFSRVMEISTVRGFYDMFAVDASTYWDTHYTFGKESQKIKKSVSHAFIDLLVINTILPIKFAYFKHKGVFKEDKFTNLLHHIRPEGNSIIDMFRKFNVNPENASDSQALIQLKNEYCNHKRCLECAIGNSLLKPNREKQYL